MILTDIPVAARSRASCHCCQRPKTSMARRIPHKTGGSQPIPTPGSPRHNTGAFRRCLYLNSSVERLGITDKIHSGIQNQLKLYRHPELCEIHDPIKCIMRYNVSQFRASDGSLSYEFNLFCRFRSRQKIRYIKIYQYMITFGRNSSRGLNEGRRHDE